MASSNSNCFLQEQTKGVVSPPFPTLALRSWLVARALYGGTMLREGILLTRARCPVCALEYSVGRFVIWVLTLDPITRELGLARGAVGLGIWNFGRLDRGGRRRCGLSGAIVSRQRIFESRRCHCRG